MLASKMNYYSNQNLMILFSQNTTGLVKKLKSLKTNSAALLSLKNKLNTASSSRLVIDFSISDFMK